MESAHYPGSLSPSPRHMRKRRFRSRFQGSLLLAAPNWGRVKARSSRRKTSYRQKRLVAATIVIVVSISIPALALTLILAR